jgi:uncharacterized protein (UPF0335 family)
MDEHFQDIKNNIYQLHERSQKTKSHLETHEAVCAERYKQIITSIERLNNIVEGNNSRIQELHNLASESKMGFKTIMFLGTVITGITAFVYTVMGMFTQ